MTGSVAAAQAREEGTAGDKKNGYRRACMCVGWDGVRACDAVECAKKCV